MTMGSISRRLTLKLLSALPFAGLSARAARANASDSPLPRESRIDRWHELHDRIFLGESVWANPMEDWKVADGWAQCLVRSRFRSIHSLAHQIVNPEAGFTTSVRLRKPDGLESDHGAGFRVGIRSQLEEYRSNCFAHRSGISAGILRDRLVLGGESAPLEKPFPSGECLLVLSGTPGEGKRYNLELVATTADGKPLGSVSLESEKQEVIGNLALASQFEEQGGGNAQRQTAPPEERVASWAFTDWRAGGDALSNLPEQHFGTILWSQYTLSDYRNEEGFVMTLSALTGPLGSDDQPLFPRPPVLS
jgi:hypothetical protein